MIRICSAMAKGYTLLKMRLRNLTGLASASLIAIGLAGCAAAVQSVGKGVTPDERLNALRHAQVWNKTDVAAMDVTRGPDGGFAPEADVECDYKADAKYGGHSPKFGCEIGKADKAD